jgi:hypothetical protein
MSDHAVVKVIDERGKDMEPVLVILRNQAAFHQFFSVADQGLSLDLGSVKPGTYELVIALANRPQLPFSVAVVAKRGAAKSITFKGMVPRCCTLTRQSAFAGTASSRTLHVFTFSLARSHHEVIMVSGWTFKGQKNFMAYVNTWRNDLYNGSTWISGERKPIAQEVFDHTVVTAFNAETGLRTRQIKGRTGWHTMDTVLQGTVPTHTGSTKHESSNRRRHDEDSLSIVHIYAYITDLGAVAPGSLHRFDVFSHAWMGGPILINTVEDPEFKGNGARSAERDPGDKDGRTKDFNSLNMPGISASNFRRAFASGASARIWGCFATKDYRHLIQAAAHATDPNSLMTVKLEDNRVLNTTGRRIEKYFRNRVLSDTYMAELAKVAQIQVFGAPPGLGSNVSRVGRRFYLYVDQKVFALEYRWYSDTIGIDPDDAGYILFS